MSQQTNRKDFGPNGKMVNTSREYEQTLIRMSRRKSRKGYRAAQIAAYGSLTAVLLLVGVNFAQARVNSNLAIKLDGQVSQTYNPAYKVRFADLGEQIITSYYTGSPTPVSLGDNVSWPTNPNPGTAVQALSAPVAEAATTKLDVSGVSFLRGDRVQTPGYADQYQERLSYYALINDVPFIVSITLGTTESPSLTDLPVLLSTPTMEQAEPSMAVDLSTQPGEGYDKADLSTEAKQQIESWALAWTTNDSGQLKQITQDTSDSVYTGLGGGWEYVAGSARPLWAATKSGQTYVEVQFQVKVPDAEVPTGEGEARNVETVVGPTQTQVMDVLLSNIDTGLPAVVSWGPAGSYIGLTPASTALTADEAKKLPEPAPSPTPSAS